jgi:hypothetical protein
MQANLGELSAVCDEVEARLRARPMILSSSSVHPDYLEAFRQAGYKEPVSHIQVRPAVLSLVKELAAGITTDTHNITTQGDEIFIARRLQGVIALNDVDDALESAGVGGVTLYDDTSVRNRLLYKAQNIRVKLNRSTMLMTEPQASIPLHSICPEIGGVPWEMKSGDMVLGGATQLIIDYTLKNAAPGDVTDCGILIFGVYLRPR